MEGVNGVMIGDEFRCKRRGHTVKVFAFKTDRVGDNLPETTVFYRNRRGAIVSIPLSRLKNASRFEPRVSLGQLAAQEA